MSAVAVSKNVLGRDKRAAIRIPVRSRCLVTFDDNGLIWTEADAAIQDLSRDGMFVRCDRVPTAEQEIALRFSLDRYGTCAANGRAVRAAGGFGVQFTSVNYTLIELMKEMRILGPLHVRQVLRTIRDARITVR